MEKIMDLHTHTVYSDGSKTPKEILEMAKEIGLSVIAITDHDMIDGIKTLDEEDVSGITFIPGVELTAQVPKGRMHILGYNIDINNPYLNEKLNNRNDIYNVKLYLKYLEDKFNITFTPEELNTMFSSIGNIGRPDIANLMIKNGYCINQDEAFDNYLNEAMDNCRRYKHGYTKEECIDMIIESGGIPVLAHPISLKMNEEELREEILYLKSIGLGGIEVEHVSMDDDYRNMLKKIALDYDLMTTGGTDYHGKNKPDIMLGTGRNNNIHVTHSSLVDYLTKENKQKIKCMTKNNPKR